jgi:hypothetical protein
METMQTSIDTWDNLGWMLVTLEDLNTVKDWIWDRVQRIFEKGTTWNIAVAWSVRRIINQILQPIWFCCSNVVIIKWDYVWKTIDRALDKEGK